MKTAITVALIALAANAQAQVVNIDSRYGFTYDSGGSDPAPLPGQHINLIGSPLVQLTLPAGSYEVTNAAGLPGANFQGWSYNVGTSSWAWAFVVANDATRQVVLYGEGGYGSSAAQVAALPAVQNYRASFTLTASTTLDFTLRDYFVADNAGGISLLVTPVPEASPAAMLALGLLLMAWRTFAAPPH